MILKKSFLEFSSLENRSHFLQQSIQFLIHLTNFFFNNSKPLFATNLVSAKFVILLLAALTIGGVLGVICVVEGGNVQKSALSP